MTTTLTRPKIALPARIYSPLAVLVFWQLGSSLGAIPERILPAPTTILAASWEVATNGTLLDALLVSSQRVLLGFALGAVLGISLGVLTGMSRFADTAVDPLIQAARALPHLGLVPLFIIWFGIGELPKVLIISLGVLYPLYLNTASGFRQIDPKLLEAGHVMGFGFFQRLRTIIIPSAAPQLFCRPAPSKCGRLALTDRGGTGQRPRRTRLPHQQCARFLPHRPRYFRPHCLRQPRSAV